MPDAAEGSPWGSAALEDDRFVADFEAGLYPHDRFRHADHVRLAWIYLRRFAVEEAEDRIRGGIRRFARQAGAERKYHETVTIAWMRLVAIALRLSPRTDDFGAFARLHGWLFQKDALLAFYSHECLASEAARREWAEPDVGALPAPFRDPE
jgi:hypothetical protein